MLDAEIIAQLDKEVADLLIGIGEIDPIRTVDGIRNILICGMDARPGETKSRSDTMVILTIDIKNYRLKLTSLMRDLYVSIPGIGNNRLNTPTVFGGEELLLSTIEQNFGLHIDEYVTVDLRLLVELVDAIGGLDVDVESDKQLYAINGVIDAYNYQFKRPNNENLLTDIGYQHLNGTQVMAYARYRKIDSDFKRTERQQEVLTMIFDVIKEMPLTELTKIAANAINRVNTNLTLSDVVSLFPVMYLLKDTEIDHLTIPFDGAYQAKNVSGMSVIVPDYTACRDKLNEFIYTDGEDEID